MPAWTGAAAAGKRGADVAFDPAGEPAPAAAPGAQTQPGRGPTRPED